MGEGSNGNGNGQEKSGRDRRQSERIPVDLSVDYKHGDTFLFSYITNISQMGIFVRSEIPLPPGTILRLRFAPPGSEPLELDGEVVWINPYRPEGENLNPGMGIRFIHLTPTMREKLVDLVRTIAYLRDEKDPDAS
ncbi:MAG: TIGR02266 family protein [Actinobacteria bacterium]|nr:TIGR02266 family protein [Actinomycetota bacterium]